MKKVDAHQHFWNFDPVRDAWIDESVQILRRDFVPKDLKPILDKHGIDGCVSVQADQSETETNFLLNLAEENDFVKGVVGWVDLIADNLKARLSHFSKNKYLKGLRHIAQAEADDYLSRKDVQLGISKLADFDLTYDILIYAHQLPAAIDLADKLPNQKFVLDHIAKPKISDGVDDRWRSNINILSSHPNVYCKLSGMVTETQDYQWNALDFRPFMDVIFNAFGVERVMYGSDWPVCLLAAKYEEQLAIVQDYIATFSADEQAKVMANNAIDFYNLVDGQST